MHAGSRYGTRSSTLLRLGAHGNALHHAEGPPCVTDYENRTTLLSSLGLDTEAEPGDLAVREAS